MPDPFEGGNAIARLTISALIDGGLSGEKAAEIVNEHLTPLIEWMSVLSGVAMQGVDERDVLLGFAMAYAADPLAHPEGHFQLEASDAES